MHLDPIEKITRVNLRDVEEIGHAFAKEVNHPGGFNYEAFDKYWGPLLDTEIGALFVIYHENRAVAILGCAFVPDCFSGLLTASESFWYVLPEYRGAKLAGKLFDAFEAEAALRGCKKILMARLETPQIELLDGIYLRRGYRPVEKTFGKEI